MTMDSHILVQYLLFFSTISLRFCAANVNEENLIQCLSNHPSTGYIKRFKYVHSQYSPSYLNLLRSAEQNPRWLNSTSLKPKFIVTPYSVDEIRAALECSKKHGLQIRVKSGGHDYEGLSYTSRTTTPFVLVDLINLRSISINMEDQTAWVQSGATIGEVYYSIAKRSSVHGFPAGICPSVGVGGHFSGGGFGPLLRKHGLAADNIIDAYLMNAQGYVLDRKSMGEDLFWAIRGGGGGSFGIILAWQIKLVRVPPVVTVFTVSKHLDREGIQVVEKWQHIATKLPEDVFIRVVLQHIIVGKSKQKSAEAIFNSLFLGNASELLPLMNTSFPELGLQEAECIEMSWIESVVYLAGFGEGSATEVLLDRIVQYKSSFKAKSDFVQEPMPESVFQGINERLMEEEVAFVIMDPYGGKMEQIGGSELPFPHRKGNLFNVQYLVKWNVETKKHVDWMNEVYEFMEPYASSSPRAAYLNYRDLDLGINHRVRDDETSYSQATLWGRKYFKENFERLAAVKKVVDPENFFSHEQSIPLL